MPQQPQWQPISQLVLIASHIDGMLEAAQEQYQTLQPARAKPHVLDNDTVGLLSHMNSERDSHIPFPDRSEAFAWRCCTMTNVQTHWFFSHTFSHWRLKCPDEPRHFSHIPFLVCAENAVCTRSRSAKQSQN